MNKLVLPIFAFLFSNQISFCQKTNSNELIEIRSTNMGIDFVLIPEGEFELEKLSDKFLPQKSLDSDRTVKISSFMVSSTEISWRQWLNIAGRKGTERIFNRAHGRQLTDRDLDYPVTGINYFEITKFCELLTIRLRNDDKFLGESLLPTEAQWEYFAKVGQDVTKAENVRRNGNPEPVVGKCISGEPNRFGLYNVIGNVSEFSRDVFLDNMLSGKDPKNVSVKDISNFEFSVRGGSYFKDKSCAKPEYRVSVPPDYSFIDTGFRVVWEK